MEERRDEKNQLNVALLGNEDLVAKLSEQMKGSELNAVLQEPQDLRHFPPAYSQEYTIIAFDMAKPESIDQAGQYVDEMIYHARPQKEDKSRKILLMGFYDETKAIPGSNVKKIQALAAKVERGNHFSLIFNETMPMRSMPSSEQLKSYIMNSPAVSVENIEEKKAETGMDAREKKIFDDTVKALKKYANPSLLKQSFHTRHHLKAAKEILDRLKGDITTKNGEIKPAIKTLSDLRYAIRLVDMDGKSGGFYKISQNLDRDVKNLGNQQRKEMHSPKGPRRT